MRVAKRFRWEAAHRLQWHEGLCRNLHGHSYRMEVIIEGPVDSQGMVIDFKDVKAVLNPLVDAWDHATFVSHDDADLRAIVDQMGWKHYVLPFDSTSENLAQYAADHLCRQAEGVFARLGVMSVSVRLEETETCYAEVTVAVASLNAGDGAVSRATPAVRLHPSEAEPPSLHFL